MELRIFVFLDCQECWFVFKQPQTYFKISQKCTVQLYKYIDKWAAEEILTFEKGDLES